MSENDIKLTDIVDLEFLQQFQDLFASIMNVASVTVDDKGPITKPSKFTDFCMEYTRGTEEGLRRCNQCDISWGKIAAKKKEPVIYKCHTGLTDFAVPIIINGEHVASILAGQVLTAPPEIEHFRDVARDLGINEEEYLDEVRKIAIVDDEHIKKAANFLFLVGNAISKIGMKNFELIRKRAREKLIKEITDKIRSSLDVEQTLFFICEETAKVFNIQRAAITVFPNPENYKEYIIRKEYKTSEGIQGFGHNEDSPKIASYWGKTLFENTDVYAISDINQADVPDYFRKNYNSMGVKSIMGTTIRKGANVWGTLILSEYNKVREWREDEKELLKTIADQIYIAINQAELFDREKKRAEREKLLRRVIETVRSSLDIAVVKKNVICEVCKSFKADRCYFRSYDRMQKKFLPVEIECLASPEIKSIAGVEPDQVGLKFFADKIEENKSGFYPVVLNAELMDSLNTRSYVDAFEIKADYALPIINRKDEVTWLVLHYTKEDPRLDDDDKKLLETIAYQIDIAFEQIQLYNEALITAEREKISRSIIEILRSSIDRTTIKQQFVRSIGKYFGASRVFFSDYDKKTKIYLPVERGCEYLSSPAEKSFVGYDWSQPAAIEYIEPLLSKREFKVECWQTYKSSKELSEDFIKLFEDADVKSSYNFPVMYQENIMGYFCVEFTQDKCIKLSDEDINRIRSMCTQAGIALYHADLYAQAQELARSKVDYMINMSNNCLTPLTKISELVSEYMQQADDELKIKYVQEIGEISRQLIDKVGSCNHEMKTVRAENFD